MVSKCGRRKNNSTVKTNENWKVSYTNINGVLSSQLELNDYIKEKKPDIIGLVETKLCGSETLIELGDQEYNMWKRNRSGKMGGGVMMLVKKDLIVDNTEIGKGKAEVLKVGIREKEGGKRDFAVVYVPPKTNAWERHEYDEMLSDTVECIQKLLIDSKNITIMGDFNCKEVNWEEWNTPGTQETWGDRLLKLAMENILTQWITKSTRFQGSINPTRLDLVFTKEPELVDQVRYQCPLGNSDHILLELDLSAAGGDKVRMEDHKNGRYHFGKADFMGLKQFYMDTNWRKFDEATNIYEKWTEFLKVYNEGVERYVPKMNTIKVKKNEWFNHKCEKARKLKEETWNRWRGKGGNNRNLWEKYTNARNEYTRILREEKRNYEKSIVDKCKAEPKLFYRFVNGKLKAKSGISSLKVNGEVYENPSMQAEIMNKCFKSVFTKESYFEEEERPPRERYLKELKVEKKEIRKIMEELDIRKAPGPDGVANSVLKECSEQLADKIHSIIESSLSEGKVPMDWKRANITPIHKGGDKDDPSNYRPVSLTSVVAKICEKVIKERWMRYLEETGSLEECQFGFRNGKSCTTNLLSFYSRLVDIVQERDGWVDCVYLDLRKAFDKVPHKRLLWKLEHIGGLKGRLLCWMEDYLKDREMRTVIKNEKSNWCSIESGVPQGSVLAPVMFVVYINDMVSGTNSYVNLFADDAKLLKRVEGQEDCEILQRDLDKILRWSKKWEMEFNTKKCKVMEFGISAKRPTSDYFMGNEKINKTKEEKDLGVTIHDDLSPEKHINKITGEAYNL